MKNNNKLLIGCIVVFILIVIITGFAYAKYVTEFSNGNIKADIANIVCDMEVTTVPTEKDMNVISPYCNILVKNYKLNDNQEKDISQLPIRYTITMTPKVNFEDAGYYWVEVENGTETIIARNTDNITGRLNANEEQTKSYKLVFQNLGNIDDLKKLVDIKIVAEQSKI